MAHVLALTLGEPAGIGPDITLAAWRRRAGPRPPAVLHPRRSRIPASPRAKSSAATSRCPWSSRRRPRRRSAIRLPVVDIGVAVTAQPGQPDDTQRAGRACRHPPRRQRRLRGRCRRRRHQSGRQEHPLPLGLHRARPHRISRQACRGSDRRSGAAGDAAVVARARGGAGHHPPAAEGRASPS